jgi:molybdopterin-guanine dinucleotide biosynthesis protein A
MSTGASGCIVAGGQARRMGGGDKGDIIIGGQTILSRLIARLQPQVQALAINANGDPARLEPYGLPVLADTMAGSHGPLAGLLTALAWSPSPLVITVAADTPFIPSDLAERLLAAVKDRDCAIASSGGRRHPVCGIWKSSLALSLRGFLDRGERKVEAFTNEVSCGVVEWEAEPYDPFFNINTPQDLLLAQKIVQDFNP